MMPNTIVVDIATLFITYRSFYLQTCEIQPYFYDVAAWLLRAIVIQKLRFLQCWLRFVSRILEWQCGYDSPAGMPVESQEKAALYFKVNVYRHTSFRSMT